MGCTSNAAWIWGSREDGMTRRGLSVLLSVSVLVPLLGVGARAQSATRIMKVEVPFEFHVLSKGYPAGAYFVRREGNFVFLGDDRGRMLNVLPAGTLRNETASPSSKVVFFEYGGLHLLTEVFWEGDKVSAELIRKGQELGVARRIVPAPVESAKVGARAARPE
jgi:hypothetical protein